MSPVAFVSVLATCAERNISCFTASGYLSPLRPLLLFFLVFVCLCGAERLALYAGRLGEIPCHAVDFTSLPGPVGAATSGPDVGL